MSIRKTLESWRNRVSGSESKPLVLTEAARNAIADYRNKNQELGDLVFHVETLPTEIGFKVKVGFELREDRELHPDHDQPVVITPESAESLRGYTIDFREGRFVTFSDITVHVAETPNPDSRKFKVNRPVMESGSATFTRPLEEGDPILARMLLEIEGVQRIFLIDQFITVTRQSDVDWGELAPTVGHRIQAYFAHGGHPITPKPVDPSSYGEVESRIISILETSVRPAVQQDGGDIAFAGFEEGVVQLYMMGSCVGCPSSMATLKMGVENLLKEKVPEVREVVAIN